MNLFQKTLTVVLLAIGCAANAVQAQNTVAMPAAPTVSKAAALAKPVPTSVTSKSKGRAVRQKSILIQSCSQSFAKLQAIGRNLSLCNPGYLVIVEKLQRAPGGKGTTQRGHWRNGKLVRVSTLPVPSKGAKPATAAKPNPKSLLG